MFNPEKLSLPKYFHLWKNFTLENIQDGSSEKLDSIYMSTKTKEKNQFRINI